MSECAAAIVSAGEQYAVAVRAWRLAEKDHDTWAPVANTVTDLASAEIMRALRLGAAPRALRLQGIPQAMIVAAANRIEKEGAGD